MENRKKQILSLIKSSKNITSEIEELTHKKFQAFSDLVKEKFLYFLENTSSTYNFEDSEKAFLVIVGNKITEIEDEEYYKLRDELKEAYKNKDLDNFINEHLDKYIEFGKLENGISRKA